MFLPEPDHHLQARQASADQLPGRRTGQFRGQLIEHGEVVAALERTGTDEGPTAHVVDGKGQLVAAVGGIDADHDGPDAGRGKLHQAPLDVVRRPDAHPIPRPDPERQQAQRQPVYLGQIFTVVPADLLVAHHHCGPVGETFRHLLQVGAYGLVKQGLIAGTGPVAEQ